MGEVFKEALDCFKARRKAIDDHYKEIAAQKKVDEREWKAAERRAKKIEAEAEKAAAQAERGKACRRGNCGRACGRGRGLHG